MKIIEVGFSKIVLIFLTGVLFGALFLNRIREMGAILPQSNNKITALKSPAGNDRYLETTSALPLSDASPVDTNLIAQLQKKIDVINRIDGESIAELQNRFDGLDETVKLLLATINLDTASIAQLQKRINPAPVPPSKMTGD